ncbi:hypothetical protein ACFYZ6_35220 [Streptomyces rubiginosohelvolus]|uniref:hypothetical protein n=1 Tax=Streptomyces rubiginosohelvolus TaxID=67362 RepID=UPI0036C35FCC
MAVIGVLTEPTPPSWWKANRHKVFGIVGLLLGFLLCQQISGGLHERQPQHPRPSHSAPGPIGH